MRGGNCHKKGGDACTEPDIVQQNAPYFFFCQFLRRVFFSRFLVLSGGGCRVFFFRQEADGATTVASTSYLASLAGVKVFVTGGMGGVHRGAETTFDVSADLAELAQTPIVVVCAGVKSILDIEKTLEVGAQRTKGLLYTLHTI